jgi:ABC-type transport system involved in Fe-S cluster assembly fused permease/ATPase subunit
LVAIAASRIYLTFLSKLYGPLNSLGYIYRSINQNLVDTERLMKLLDEPPEVNDKPNASALHVESGEIEFGAVSILFFLM